MRHRILVPAILAAAVVAWTIYHGPSTRVAFAPFDSRLEALAQGRPGAAFGGQTGAEAELIKRARAPFMTG